jgi:hypothetical protein
MSSGLNSEPDGLVKAEVIQRLERQLDAAQQTRTVNLVLEGSLVVLEVADG